MNATSRLAIAVICVVSVITSEGGVFAAEFLPAERVGEILRFGQMRYASGGPPDIDYVDFLTRLRANVSHGFAGVGFGVSWGFPDRTTFDKKRAKARQDIARLHARGILVITYISPILWYGDSQKRTGVFDFYDKRWKDYEDFLGPRPSDPMEWVQVWKDGTPQPYEYKGERGFYWCVNNPATRQYIQGAIKMDVENGVDGVFYDGPSFYPKTCYCAFCQKLFREHLASTLTPTQRKALFGKQEVEAFSPPESPKDGPLFVEWNRFRTLSLVRFMRETRSFARTLNPNFVLTVNYCMGGDPYGALSACGEEPAAYRQAQDILFNETNLGASPSMRQGKRVTNSPSFQFLAAAAKGQPVVVTNYLAQAERPEAYANLTRLSMAEALANHAYAIPWWPHHPDPDVVQAYNAFMEQNRDALIGTRPFSEVGLVCSVQQGYARMRSDAMPVSRLLLDMGVPHTMVLDEDLADARLLKEYRVLILPHVPMLSDRQIATLRDFFLSGGNLVVIGACGVLDEHARPRPDGLLQLVGTAASSQDVFRGESGNRRMVFVPPAKWPKLPLTGREPIQGDFEPIQKAIAWAAHDVLPCINPAAQQVEVHLATKQLDDERRTLLAHIVNYQVDLAGKVTPVHNLKLKLLIPVGHRVTEVRLLSERTPIPLALEEAGARSYLVLNIPRLLIYEAVEVLLIRVS